MPAEDGSGVVPAGGLSETTNVIAFQPLLDRLPSLSSHCSPSQVKVGMSLETLHCESEVLYYYAQIESVKNEESSLTGERTVSKSMHNLGPSCRRSVSDEEEFLTISRQRSYSHGDQSLQPILLDNINRDCALVTGNKGEIVSDPEEKSLISGSCLTKHGNMNGRSSSSMKQDITVEVSEKSEGKEERTVKQCSKLRSCWHSIRHSAVARILRYCIYMYFLDYWFL